VSKPTTSTQEALSAVIFDFLILKESSGFGENIVSKYKEEANNLTYNVYQCFFPSSLPPFVRTFVTAPLTDGFSKKWPDFASVNVLNEIISFFFLF